MQDGLGSGADGILLSLHQYGLFCVFAARVREIRSNVYICRKLYE